MDAQQFSPPWKACHLHCSLQTAAISALFQGQPVPTHNCSEQPGVGMDAHTHRVSMSCPSNRSYSWNFLCPCCAWSCKINPRGPHTALLPLLLTTSPQSALVTFSAPAMVPSRWRAPDRAQLPEFGACSGLENHASHMSEPRCCFPTTSESDICLYRVSLWKVFSASASNPDLNTSESCTDLICPRTTVAREAGSEQGGAKAMAGSYFDEIFMPAENETLSEL